MVVASWQPAGIADVVNTGAKKAPASPGLSPGLSDGEATWLAAAPVALLKSCLDAILAKEGKDKGSTGLAQWSPAEATAAFEPKGSALEPGQILSPFGASNRKSLPGNASRADIRIALLSLGAAPQAH